MRHAFALASSLHFAEIVVAFFFIDLISPIFNENIDLNIFYNIFEEEKSAKNMQFHFASKL